MDAAGHPVEDIFIKPFVIVSDVVVEVVEIELAFGRTILEVRLEGETAIGIQRLMDSAIII